MVLGKAMAFTFLITFFEVHISDFLLCKKWVALNFGTYDKNIEIRPQPTNYIQGVCIVNLKTDPIVFFAMQKMGSSIIDGFKFNQKILIEGILRLYCRFK